MTGRMGLAFVAALRSVVAGALLGACSTAGNTWINQPEGPDGYETEEDHLPHDPGEQVDKDATPFVPSRPVKPSERDDPDTPGGRLLGRFRNTYYDFPAAGDYKGKKATLFNAKCEPIARVPQGFHDAVCVQGSGTLRTGETVSFAKRDCECARVCPRTKQRICFDKLNRDKFPWGRGATGNAITPMLTIAVDSAVIPMGSSVYIPEYDGLPRDESRSSLHDGCFIAQDRGLKIKGRQVDVFTGHERLTKLWNRLVPSNQGITVFLESPRCARADVKTGARADSKPSVKK